MAHVAARAGTVVDPGACRDWHRTMFAPSVPMDYYAGNFRQLDHRRPCLGVDVKVGSCYGTPPMFVPQATEMLFRWLGREIVALRALWNGVLGEEQSKRAAILLGEFASRFIKIHPFVNGNGRTSKLLLAWGMMYFGFRPPFTVHIRPEGRSYAWVMQQAMNGNPAPLQLFLLNSIRQRGSGTR